MRSVALSLLLDNAEGRTKQRRSRNHHLDSSSSDFHTSSINPCTNIETMRQRTNKKSTEVALLPITSIDNNDDKQRRREWRRKSRRRQPKTRKGQSLYIIAVVTSIVVFAITCVYYINIYSSKRVQDAYLLFDFQCSNYPQKGILNDDYCDCPDGSDEPMTSACSHVLVGQKLFSCTATSTGDAIKLFPSRIRDGVVDCHDESDEK